MTKRIGRAAAHATIASATCLCALLPPRPQSPTARNSRGPASAGAEADEVAGVVRTAGAGARPQARAAAARALVREASNARGLASPRWEGMTTRSETDAES